MDPRTIFLLVMLIVVGIAALLLGVLAFTVKRAKRATGEANCIYCGSPAMHRAAPNITDELLTFWNCIPYRCEVCSRRQYKLDPEATVRP